MKIASSYFLSFLYDFSISELTKTSRHLLKKTIRRVLFSMWIIIKLTVLKMSKIRSTVIIDNLRWIIWMIEISQNIKAIIHRSKMILSIYFVHKANTLVPNLKPIRRPSRNKVCICPTTQISWWKTQFFISFNSNCRKMWWRSFQTQRNIFLHRENDAKWLTPDNNNNNPHRDANKSKQKKRKKKKITKRKYQRRILSSLVSNCGITYEYETNEVYHIELLSDARERQRRRRVNDDDGSTGPTQWHGRSSQNDCIARAVSCLWCSPVRHHHTRRGRIVPPNTKQAVIHIAKCEAITTQQHHSNGSNRGTDIQFPSGSCYAECSCHTNELYISTKKKEEEKYIHAISEFALLHLLIYTHMTVLGAVRCGAVRCAPRTLCSPLAALLSLPLCSVPPFYTYYILAYEAGIIWFGAA